MATQVRFRRGNTSAHSTFTGAEGEMTIDTTKNSLVVHDGSTAGGYTIGKEDDLSNIQTDITSATTSISLLEDRPRANLIKNGSLDVWQRGTGPFTNTPVNHVRTADMWSWGADTTTTGIGSVNQYDSTSPPNSKAQSLEVNVTTAKASLAAGDWFLVQQNIEGYDILGIGFGQPWAQNLTLSFYVNSSLTGTHCVAFRNAYWPDIQTYVAEYTVNTANTWEKKEITITGHTSGVWAYDNTLGLTVFFTVAAGSNYNAASTDTWLSGNFVSTSNQVNLMATVGNKFRITQVKLEIGDSATDFIARPYADELALCQRYYEVGRAYYAGNKATAPSGYIAKAEFLQSKRVNPSITFDNSTGNGFDLTPTKNGGSEEFVWIREVATVSGSGKWFATNYYADAEM